MLKSRFTNNTNAQIAVPSNDLSNFWRILQIALINCEINLIITWSANCVINNASGATTFAMTNAKRYLPLVFLSIQDNLKLL